MERRIRGNGADHPNIFLTLHNLGTIALDTCEYDGAQGWYHLSLEMRKRMYGKSVYHPAISSTLHQLGKVAQEKREYHDALNCYHQALDMLKRIHGNDVDHPDIISSLEQIGSVAESRGDYDDALQDDHLLILYLYCNCNILEHNITDVVQVKMKQTKMGKSRRSSSTTWLPRKIEYLEGAFLLNLSITIQCCLRFFSLG